MNCPRRIALVVITALAVCAPAPASAATPIAAVGFTLADHDALYSVIGDGCIQIVGLGWREDSDGTYYTPGPNDAAGSWDPYKRSSTVIASGDLLQFEPTPPGGHARPIKLSALGLELAGGRAYLTASVRPAKRRVLSGLAPRRQRIALISHPRFTAGPDTDRRGRPVPMTLLFGIEGDALMTKAFAATISRIRCHQKQWTGPLVKRIRPGLRLGRLSATLFPSGALGVTSRGHISVFSLARGGEEVTVTGGDGIVRTADGALDIALAPATRLPLLCDRGIGCDVYSTAPIPLPGSLTLSYGERSTVIGALSVTYTLEGSLMSIPVPTLHGTLDGAPVTIGAMESASGGKLDDDFVARMGTALGTQFSGGAIGALGFDWDSIGPVP
jgi:hypothetical protein